jgi:cellulose synthase/poly-beta-1,6-N-acetylglucosamine synthase-like glycosyltransferase
LLTIVVVFLFAAGVQLTYFIIFIAALKKLQTRSIQKTGDLSEPVSIIVCAHDEEENLKQLVPKLLEQDYENLEVIIVNDRSNDNTYDYLLEATKNDTRLKMVNIRETPDHVNSKKFALTLGIRAAANEWILLTDADCRPGSRDWVKRMSNRFTGQTNFVLGFSPYLEGKTFLNLFIRFESIVSALQYLSFAVSRNPFMGVGRNLAYRKSLFLQKKGFNDFLGVTGGDDDLFVNQHANGNNTTVEVSAGSVVYSIPETSWSAFFHQKIRHLSVGKFYKTKHKFLIGLFHASWIVTLFVGFALLPFYEYYYGIIALLLIRWLLIIFGIKKLTTSTGLTFNLWMVPVLDFLFPFYYISTGLVTLFTKKVRWKKK